MVTLTQSIVFYLKIFLFEALIVGGGEHGEELGKILKVMELVSIIEF
jgi:hypothetical protein